MPEHEHSDESLVPVAVAAGEIEAALWRDALADAGIRAMVKNTGPGAGYFPSFSDQFVLYVLASAAERAREILAELAGDGETELPTDS